MHFMSWACFRSGHSFTILIDSHLTAEADLSFIKTRLGPRPGPNPPTTSGLASVVGFLHNQENFVHKFCHSINIYVCLFQSLILSFAFMDVFILVNLCISRFWQILEYFFYFSVWLWSRLISTELEPRQFSTNN